MRKQKRRRTFFDLIFILGFLGVVGLPLFAMVLPAYRVHTSRDDTVAPLAPPGKVARLLPRPVWRVAQTARDFLHNFKASFAFRDTFVRWNAIAKVRWMKTSSSPDVVIGKNGWLFYTQNYTLIDYRHLAPWDDEKIGKVRAFFQFRHDQLAKSNIRFLVVVAPNKHSIYPEEMPDELAPVPGPTHLDQFVEAMKSSDVEVLDLRPALLRAKAQHAVYSRTDTHWNAYGSLAAYQATAARLKQWFPKLKTATPREYEFRAVAPDGGDLSRLLGLQNEMKEPGFEIRLRAPRAFASETIVKPTSDRSGFQRLITTHHASGEIPRAVIFGDSFTNTQWRTLLSQHFAYAVCYHRRNTDDARAQSYDEAFVARTKPNLVIYQVVERALGDVSRK